ncbi:hypothetical protein [Rothia terrae]|uniref:Uncharacterized protein n=1 Tax=Rothia terrae TaxID=396015 RepID=A0A7H2BGE2_9MICC|nr:hypothetical protein [Rothia terrae]QNV38738.1 hypothetical protein IDM49_05725 [Rothia terrae]
MTTNNRYNINGIQIAETNGDIHLSLGDISNRIMTPRQADEIAKNIREASSQAQRTRAEIRKSGHTAKYLIEDEPTHPAQLNSLTLQDFENDPALIGIDKNGKKINYAGVKAGMWIATKSPTIRKITYPGLTDEQIFQAIYGPVKPKK